MSAKVQIELHVSCIRQQINLHHYNLVWFHVKGIFRAIFHVKNK